MIGSLFNHGVAPSEIDAMDWGDLSYWFEWYERIVEANKPK